MASEQAELYVKELEKLIDSYHDIHNILATREEDENLPIQIKEAKMFSLMNLLNSFAHYQTYKRLIEDSIKYSEEIAKESEKEKQEDNDETSKHHEVKIKEEANIKESM